MSKFEIMIVAPYQVIFEKTYSVIAENEQEAKGKAQTLFEKWLNSLPYNKCIGSDEQEISCSKLGDEELVYENNIYNQFVADMKELDLEVEDYKGRFYYHGPAVRCDDPQEVIKKTSVSCQWDSMGLGYIVYPR